MQPVISFQDTMVNVAVQEQEDVEATVTVTKRYEPLHLKEEALALSPLLAIETTLRELAQDMASLKQEMFTFKQNLAHPSKVENTLWRDQEEDWKC